MSIETRWRLSRTKIIATSISGVLRAQMPEGQVSLQIDRGKMRTETKPIVKKMVVITTIPLPATRKMTTMTMTRKIRWRYLGTVDELLFHAIENSIVQFLGALHFGYPGTLVAQPGSGIFGVDCKIMHDFHLACMLSGALGGCLSGMRTRRALATDSSTLHFFFPIRAIASASRTTKKSGGFSMSRSHPKLIFIDEQKHLRRCIDYSVAKYQFYEFQGQHFYSDTTEQMGPWMCPGP